MDNKKYVGDWFLINNPSTVREMTDFRVYGPSPWHLHVIRPLDHINSESTTYHATVTNKYVHSEECTRIILANISEDSINNMIENKVIERTKSPKIDTNI